MKIFILIIMLCMSNFATAQTGAYLDKLNEKTTWKFSIGDNLYGLEGDFAGINGDIMQVRDEEGFKHQIPIDSLIETDRALFWEFHGDYPIVGAPGAHSRRMDNELFRSYQERMTERRVYALKTRAEINAMKPPARGWLALRVPYDPLNPLGIGLWTGFVRQPPIPYYPRRVLLFSSPGFYEY